MKLQEAIEKRRSIRKFKNKIVKWSHVLEAIDAALHAPLAGNSNSLKFIIVTDQDIKNEIATYADQAWISHADTILVACSDNSTLEMLYSERGAIYARQQVGAAIQNLLLRLTDLGLGACWVGAYLDKGIKETLEIPEKINVEAIIPIGYPDEKPHPVRKEALESRIYWDKWNVKKKPTLAKDPKTW